jgi:hypothetical protein
MLYKSTSGQVLSRPRQATRCRRSKKGQSKNGTAGVAGYGFLKHRFLPVRENKYPVLQNRRQVENEFFRSLSNLAGLYKVEPLNVESYAYPYNIYKAFEYAKAQIEGIDKNLHVLIIQDKDLSACIATAKIFDTGTTLYYIPVRPLFDLINNKSRKHVASLLLSIYSWLYRVIKVPFYTNINNYVGSCYGSLESWYMDEEVGNEEDIKEFEEMRQCGMAIERKIKNPSHLQLFERRIKRFIAVSDTERELLVIGKKAFNLYTRYPERSAFENMRENFIYAEIEERIYPEQYLSFFWDSKGNIYDSLMDYVNTELQEMGAMDEPVAVQLFDKQQDKPIHDLDFEKELFTVIDDLCKILNELE